MTVRSRRHYTACDRIIAHKGRHRGTVVLLHAMYGSVHDFFMLTQYLSCIGCRCVLMAAPHRTVHWPTGSEENVTCWYDYYTKRDGEDEHDTINIRHLESQTERLISVVKTEMKYIDPSKIIVGGYSQGGTVVMHACAIGSLNHVGGVISLRSCFIHSLVKNPSVKNTKIMVFAGSNDDVYSLSLQRKAFSVLEESGALIEWVVINGLKHHTKSTSELNFSIKFISSIIS